MATQHLDSGPPLRQEDDRIDRRWLVATLTSSAAFLLLLSVAAVLLLAAFTRERPAAPSVAARPRQGSAVTDLHTGLFAEPAAGELLKRRQRAELAHYGWVDRERGIVRVPIEVAIDRVVAEGR